MAGRAVVTGLGVVAPGTERGTDAYWKMLVDGRTATRRITHFDPERFRCQVAAEADFDPVLAGLSPQEARRMDRTAQFSVVAAREALVDSGLVIGPGGALPSRVGVSVGNAVGCTMGLESEYVVISDGGRKWLCDDEYAVPELYDYLVPSSVVRETAWAVGAEGPVSLISTGCTSGIDALGNALRLIEEGEADVVVAGAAEAPISPITVACFDAIKATSTRNDTPESACRPFDATRNGLVLGEGAAVLVLESREHAEARGARVRAEIVGYDARANAFHMTGLKPDGREMSEAIDTALAEAGLRPEDVDYVNAHGSGTKQNDRHETAAVKRSLGDHARRVPMSSIKSMIGHSLGAIGALEVVACVKAIEENTVPPTANHTTDDPECDLDYVVEGAREQRTDVALSVGSGFGGFQSAIVIAAEGRVR
ncbi:beta-ketoacyl-[acyl-carrier-protein] synthase family protein [Nocardiopsis alba]|jgi:act minimal PKS ketosynthase (KS/KS alpha)